MMPHTGSYTFFQSTVSGTNQHSHAKRELCFVDLEAARLQQWSNEKKMFTCLSLWRKCKIYVFKNLTTIYILHLQTHFNTYDFNFILYYNMPGTSYARIYSPWWYWDICPNSTITWTFYIRGYDLCRSLLKSNGDDSYYDILFQSSTTVHQCPSSINLTVAFSSTEFRIIQYLLGDDNYVLGNN